MQWGQSAFVYFLYYYNRLATTFPYSVFRLKNRFAFESPESDRPVRQWFTRHTGHISPLASAPATSQQTKQRKQDCPSRGDCGVYLVSSDYWLESSHYSLTTH